MAENETTRIDEAVSFPESSNLRRLEYHGDDAGDAEPKLLATFRDGTVYRYSGVPSSIWLQLRDPEGSAGALFTRLVARGGFPYSKIDADDEDMKPIDAEARQDPTARRFTRRERRPATPAEATQQRRRRRDRRTPEERRQTRPK